jgi:hypothetical protein
LNPKFHLSVSLSLSLSLTPLYRSAVLEDLLGVVRSEVKGCNDAKRLLAAVGAVLGLAVCPSPVGKGAFSIFTALLGHKFPKVRRVAAEQFYFALIATDGAASGEEEDEEEVFVGGPTLVHPSKRDAVLDILDSVLWDGPVRQCVCVWISGICLICIFTAEGCARTTQ